MKQRLEQFLSAENITKAQFADSINVARAAISHIVAGRNNPSYDFIVNTMDAYPDLNIEWLLKGKGKMYKSDKSADMYEAEGSIFNSHEDINSVIPPQVSKPQQVDTRNKISGARVKKIVVFYSDNTFQEFC